MMRAYLFALPAAAFLSVAAAPPADKPATVDKASDPNQVICEKQPVTGSRLSTRRVCKTRAQWADDRMQDRQEIEKAQTQIGVIR
jgi:hypothetical protein